MAFTKFGENRFRIDGEIAENHAILVNLTVSIETSIFTPGAPHEEVQGRQTKLHPGFTLDKLVQHPPGISILRDSHIVLSKQSQ